MQSSQLAQTPQTPLWVSILLAAIALVGPIGAALITVKHSNGRWKRERTEENRRDQLRHDREMEKLRVQLQHSALADWRAERVGALSGLIDAFDDCWRSISTLESHGRWILIDSDGSSIDPGPPPSVTEIENLYSDFRKAANKLDIIGTPTLSSAVQDLVSKTGRVANLALRIENVKSEGGEIQNSTLGRELARLESSRDNLVKLARGVILADDIQDSETRPEKTINP